MDYEQLLLTFEQSQEIFAETLLFSCWNKENIKVHISKHQKNILHYSCYNGWKNLSVRLIEEFELDPSFEDHEGNTSLHMACMSGNIDIVKYLASNKKYDPFQSNNVDHTALQIAIKHSHIDAHMQCNCDPFQTNGDGLTALDIAIKYQNCRVVSYLINKCGCDKLCQSMGTRIMKLLYDYWDEKVALSLIRDGGCQVTMENGTTLLHEFANKEFAKRVLFLLTTCSFDPNFLKNSSGNTILHEYCQFLFFKSMNEHLIFEQFILQHKCNPNIENANGETVLHTLFNSLRQCGYSAFRLYVLFFLLRECKMSPHIQLKNMVDTEDKTLLRICETICQSDLKSSSSILYKLIAIECKYDPFQTNDDIYTTLSIAIKYSDSLTVSYIVAKCGRHHSLYKQEGIRIMKLVHEFWDKEIAKCIILGGCPLVMENGTTLLHQFAIKEIEPEVAFLLTTCKCDPFQTNREGHTVLDCAIMASKITMVSYFINTCGFDRVCKATGEKIMKLLYNYWNEEVAKCLICDGGCPVIMENGTTLLHEFACKGHVSRLYYLLSECDCDQNLMNKNGNTILHEFFQLLFLDHDSPITSQLQYLTVDLKCNPNIKNANGETVLHIVCNSLLRCGYNEDRCGVLFFLLLELKMSPDIQLKNTDKSLLHTVCEAIFHGYHDPSILCYLIVECKCDPHIDKDMVLLTLLQSIILWQAHEPTIDVLCYLLAESKIDPYISLGNDKSVCSMCCPIKRLNLKFATLSKSRSLNGQHCLVCKSLHNYDFARVCSTVLEDSSFIIVIFSKVYSASSVKDVALSLKLLCYFITFINICKCNCYQTLAAHESVIEQLSVYCLSPEAINDPVRLAALRKLIITLDCQVYISYNFLHLLLKCNCETSSQVLEEVQQHLIKMHPFKIAKCIAYNLDSYSPRLFHFINMLDLTTTDGSGNTVLHLACQYFNGNTTLIEYILSTGKADPLCCNNDDQTPMMLLSKRSKLFVGAKKKVQQMIHLFGRVKVSHPIESCVNLVVLGNPGVGKSSLVKVIIDRPNSRLRYALGRLKYVTEVDLYTAGIIPHIHNDKDLGRIILHDLAGQAEYYSSHTAVLENLLQGSSAVFIVVISLADEMLQESFQFWLTTIENVCHHALCQCHLFVVASHADIVTDNSASKIDILKKLLSSRLSSSDIIRQNKLIKLDCRKLGGNQLDILISSLSSTCKSVSLKKMTIYCHLLYDFFQINKKVILYQLESLLEIFLQRNDLFLPTSVGSLVEIVHSLSSTGLIVFLRNKEFLAKSWIVTDKSILLAELNGVLFAPEDFKEYVSIASNTGVIKLSDLSARFPNYDSELLVKFLQYMELCEVITEEFMSLKLLSGNKVDDVNNEQYIFVPALIKDTQKPQIEEAFTFGWVLQCTNPHDFFFSRFLHLALLHLACKYSKTSGANKFERLCKVWTTGIYWKDTKGVQTLLEQVDNKKSLVLLTTCQDGAVNEMIKLIKNIIIEILSCKQQVMPKIDTCEFVIDNSHLQYPLKSFRELTLYNIELISECYINDDKFIIDRTGMKQTPISNLFPEVTAQQYYESIFADRDPKNLIAGNLQVSVNHDLTTSVTSNKESVNVEMPMQISSALPAASLLIIKSPCKILKDYTSQLIEILSEPQIAKLTNDLSAVDLLSDIAKDEISTNHSLSRYRKASFLLKEVEIQISSNYWDFFERFCNVLKEQGNPALSRISEEMMQQSNSNVSRELDEMKQGNSTVLREDEMMQGNSTVLRELDEMKQGNSTALRESDEMKQGNSTVLREDKMMQGNSTVLRESDEMKQGNSTVLREVDEMMQGNSMEVRESDEMKQGNSMVLQELDEMMHGNSTVLRESDEKKQGNSMVLRELNEMMQGNSTVTRESDEMKRGNSTVLLRESDEMMQINSMVSGESNEKKKGNSTLLGKSDEMMQGNSTVSTSVTHKRTAFLVLKEHTPVLLGLLSDPDKLSNELWVKDLLSDGVRDRIQTTSSLSQYDKSTMILTEVLRYVKLPEYEDIFVRFCDVLKNHRQPGLKEIAEKMISLVTD